MLCMFLRLLLGLLEHVAHAGGTHTGQRAANEPTDICKLAALRVPEWEVMHDDGVRATLE